jgi:tetratricopeptide (TPR) repeat protein
MRNLIYTLLIIALAACTTHQGTRAQLDQAEALMTELPDSALAILQQVDDAQLTTNALQARFALLLSMALDKNYIDIASDSLIRPAVEYYEKHGTDRDKMLTCYYLANTYINADETANCLISLTDAEKYAKKIEDYFYLGMIYRMMADAYNDIYCRNEELKYRQQSYDSFKMAGSQRHINFAYLDLGIALSNTHQYTQAIDIYKDLLIVAEDNIDSILVNNCLSHLGHSYSLNGNYRESITSILKQSSLFPQRVMSKDYRNLARDYAALAMPDSAIFYMKKAENLIKNNIDTQVTYSINYELSKYTGDYKTALENYEELFDLNAYVTDSIMGKSVLVTLQDYITQQAEYDNFIAKQKRNRLYYIITFLVLGIIAASIILYLRWKNKNQEIEKNLQLAQSIRDTLHIKEGQLSEMNTQIQALFSQQFSVIDELCNVYFETKDTKAEKDRIYKEVLKQINDIGTNKVSQLEVIVNTYRNQIMRDFRKDFPNLNSDIYQFAIYQFSGFSSRAISIFMNEKIENVYNKKSRLKSRIQKSDVPRKEEYLSLMA